MTKKGFYLTLINADFYGGQLTPGLVNWGLKGRRHRLELSMVSPELVSRFQGITYGLWAKWCYTHTRRGQEFCRESIYTLLDPGQNEKHSLHYWFRRLALWMSRHIRCGVQQECPSAPCSQ